MKKLTKNGENAVRTRKFCKYVNGVELMKVNVNGWKNKKGRKIEKRNHKKTIQRKGQRKVYKW